MYGGIFKNPDGTAFLSGDVPHLYRVWSCVQSVVYRTIEVSEVFDSNGCRLNAAYSGAEGVSHGMNCPNGSGSWLVTPMAGVFSQRYSVIKWRAFLPSIQGVGAPLLASMRMPSTGFHAIDSIEVTAGGYYVYGLSAPDVSIRRSTYAADWYYWQGYTANNQCGYRYNRIMQPTTSGSIEGFTITAQPNSSIPIIDAYAAYTGAIGGTHNYGLSLRNTTGEEIFKYPALFDPIKARVEAPQVPAPTMLSSGETRALDTTVNRSVVFFGVGQYVFDRAFYTHNTVCSYGCDGFSGCLNYYGTKGVTILLRNMINSSGIVRRIPVKTSMYSSTSYTDNSSVVGFGGSPVSSSGSTSSGYKISTSVSNTDGEYAIAIPV